LKNNEKRDLTNSCTWTIQSGTYFAKKTAKTCHFKLPVSKALAIGKKMSLTSLIKDDKELRQKISATFLRPKLDKSKPLLIESNTKHAALIGVAFDYLFRFHLERINKVDTEKPWVSELSIERLLELERDEEKYNTGIEIINNVKSLKEKFIKTGDCSIDLIKETLRMSYIDPYYRSGFGAEYIGSHADEEDINETKKQIDLINLEEFRAKNICLLNPTFGDASGLVGGADADFLVDDKLIDIKTTKKLALSLNDFCQIIGYYVLHEIGGINANKKIKINKIGIYYSRYAYLFIFNIQDIINKEELSEFIKWFSSRVK